MLKKLTARHKKIMRRLVVGESPKEIAVELGMNPVSIRRLISNEPLFASELYEMERRAEANVVQAVEELDAVKIIEDAAGRCAKLVSDTVDDVQVDIKLRLQSAWDLLERNTETSKKGSGSAKAALDLTELIILAAERREARNKPIAIEATSEDV